MRYRYIQEGFTDLGSPDLKYYAFDWDDNIVHMPTKIRLKNDKGDMVPMSTSDFANYREKIGKQDFDYDGETIVGYFDDPFRNFRTEGDNQFLIDAMKAKPGPAFDDFKEAINNGSVFAIITARGHNPEILKETIYNYIVTGFEGIDKTSLIKNLKKYRSFVGEDDMTDDELIKSYLELNRYNPVAFGVSGAEANPEELKVQAMENFVSYVKSLASVLNKKAFLKKDISNNFLPDDFFIGFSDDDEKNVETMRKHFKEKPDSKVRTFYTGKGIKQRV